MTKRLVYFNGDFVPEDEARISIFDSALMFGDMVFEMTRTFNQKPYRLRHHLERLYESIKYAEIDLDMTIDEMEEATFATIEKRTARPSAATTSRSCTTSRAGSSGSTPSWCARGRPRSSPSTSSR